MDLGSTKNSIQDALDRLLSSRSSSHSKSLALSALEHLIALVCIPCDSRNDLDLFKSLQDTFECNIPSRLLAWISQSTHTLELLTNKGSIDYERETDATTLSAQLSQSLTIIQGVALNHDGSKRYLGRRYSLEVLLDLLLASRHVSAMPLTSTTNYVPGTKPPKSPPPLSPLSSVVLDTLLCILVDSSPALRVFEDVGGVQAVVKLLKRANTPREVRMKCLEFLYFYLLDETSQSTPTSNPHSTPSSPTKQSLAPTAPSTPIRTTAGNSKPLPFGVKPTPSLSSTSSTYSSFTSTSSFSSTSSNASSTLGRCSSFSSNGTGTTSPTVSPSTSPSLSAGEDGPPKTRITPPSTPPSYPKTPVQSRGLMMLQKEVNFVPVSPKKPPGLGRSDPSTPAKVGPRLRDVSLDGWVKGGTMGNSSVTEARLERGTGQRTTEEKKVLLGGLLGNVDALVEGVRMAGVWGLG